MTRWLRVAVALLLALPIEVRRHLLSGMCSSWTLSCWRGS